MKKAFTMIEFVFVLILITILAVNIFPRIKTNHLNEAAIQLVSHIRYTQHLSMIADKYDASDQYWFKKRWQIVFINSAKANYKYAYTIFSDSSGNSTGDPNVVEIAKNPENPSQLMTGGSSGGEARLGYNHKKFPGMKKLNLGMSYGITDITFSSSCSVNRSRRISFDYLGRPLKGKLGGASGGGNSSAYEDNNLIQSNCIITLTDGENDIQIKLTPETGFVCILKLNSTMCR